MTHLPGDALAGIQRLCEEGDQLLEEEQFTDALIKYWTAWELLPEPRHDWNAATWVMASIGNANFLSGDYEAGRDNLSGAMRCPAASGNAFLHLRLGQCQFELGNLARAADELARAYSGDGHAIFEDQDPKYLRFLKTSTDPPEDGWEDEKKPWWKFW